MKEINELRYAKSHEWAKVDGVKAYIGLTDYAQSQLGEVVFVDLPELGSQVKAGGQLAEVESVKAVSEIYSPVSGTVVEINEDLLDNPGLVNEDAYGNWFVVIEILDSSELENLLNASEYAALCDALTQEVGR